MHSIQKAQVKIDLSLRLCWSQKVCDFVWTPNQVWGVNDFKQIVDRIKFPPECFRNPDLMLHEN